MSLKDELGLTDDEDDQEEPEQQEEEQPELEHVKAEIVDLPDTPPGVVAVQLQNYKIITGDNARIKAVFVAKPEYETIHNLFQYKEKQVRLVEPPREIQRPDTEVFGTLMDFKTVCRGKQRVILNIEFELEEYIAERLNHIAMTADETMWLHETQMELRLDGTENG